MGGMGMGIDRLIMLFTDAGIRDDPVPVASPASLSRPRLALVHPSVRADCTDGELPWGTTAMGTGAGPWDAPASRWVSC